MIAPALIIAPIYILFLKVKLANSLIGLVLANAGMTIAFSTWILKGFFDNIPKEIDDAAFIDGCSYFQVFRNIILPLSTSAIITIVILAFFDVYNEYMFAMTLITNQDKWLGTVGLTANTTRVGTNWNVMLAQTVLFCIVPLLFYFIFQRHIVKGLTAGALKF
jgi:ABC-type glycerol-3-phosphate transport system permease component